MKVWKQDKNTRKVHDELYERSEPENEESETYLSLIIKSVLTSEKECIDSNGMWVQSVIESIFDEENLSTKIDSEVIET
jgi:polyhydroxyalkanoate synthesis regulator phasin